MACLLTRAVAAAAQLAGVSHCAGPYCVMPVYSTCLRLDPASYGVRCPVSDSCRGRPRASSTQKMSDGGACCGTVAVATTLAGAEAHREDICRARWHRWQPAAYAGKVPWSMKLMSSSSSSCNKHSRGMPQQL